MLINMRNGLMAGKRLSAKSYVQDGLVAMWDGIENAGWGVHDPNATVWKDLTGNGWDFPSGDLLFHSDHVEALANSISVKSSTEFWDWSAAAFESVCERPYTTASNNGFFTLGRLGLPSINNNYVNGYMWYASQSTNNWRVMYPYGVSAVDKRFDLAHRGFVTDFTSPVVNQKAFRNGIYIPNDVYTSEPWTQTITHGSLGMKLVKGSTGTPKYWCIRLYSRALTAAEVAANYAVDKARFSLPDAT